MREAEEGPAVHFGMLAQRGCLLVFLRSERPYEYSFEARSYSAEYYTVEKTPLIGVERSAFAVNAHRLQQRHSSEQATTPAHFNS